MLRPPPGSSPRAWSDGLYEAIVSSDRPGASLAACADYTGLPLRVEAVAPDDLPALLLQAEPAAPSAMQKERA